MTRTQVVLPRDNPFEILLDRFTVALPKKKNQRGGKGGGGVGVEIQNLWDWAFHYIMKLNVVML